MLTDCQSLLTSLLTHQVFGWVLEMWGYTLAATRLNIRHTVWKEFQVHTPCTRHATPRRALPCRTVLPTAHQPAAICVQPAAIFVQPAAIWVQPAAI